MKICVALTLQCTVYFVSMDQNTRTQIMHANCIVHSKLTTQESEVSAARGGARSELFTCTAHLSVQYGVWRPPYRSRIGFDRKSK